MTTDAATAFAERLKTDGALRSRLAGAATREERLALARAEGFDLSADDMGAVRQAMGLDELSDEDLARVAGGIGTTTAGTVAATAGGVIQTIAAAAAAA